MRACKTPDDGDPPAAGPATATGRRAVCAAIAGASIVRTARAAATVNLVFDGDSISAGWGAREQRLDERVAALLGGDVALHNVAAGGRPVHECLRLYDSLVAPLFVRSAACNVIAFHAGDNDINQGRDAEETYAVFRQYVARAHAQGWKLAVSTELPVPDFPPAKAEHLGAYNAMLLRNEAGADAVVDFTRDPRMTQPSYRRDPAWFADKVHPSDQGYAVLAALLAPAVRRLIDR